MNVDIDLMATNCRTVADNHHYRRDSFDDRIYDDLSEVLLSYLPLKDKLRLQCVSKQFRRCLTPRRQYQLVIRRQVMGKWYDRCLNVRTFEWLLKTFPNITYISLDLSDAKNGDQLVDIIISHCKHLKTININFYREDWESGKTIFKLVVTRETLERFLCRFGRQLRQIGTFRAIYPPEMSLFLAKCDHLCQIDLTSGGTNYLWSLQSAFASPESIDAMRTVKRLSINYRSATDYPIICRFVDNNHILLERMECNETIDNKDNRQLLDQISRLVNIRQLKLHLHCNQMHNSFRSIAANCHHLSELEISFYSSVTYLPFMAQNGVLNAIKYLRQLKRFTFHFIEYCESDFLNNCLKHSHQLRDLSLYSINDITDTFFDNIDKHLPNLKHLKIINADLTDTSLNWLSKLPKLETIGLFNLSESTSFSESSVDHILDNCPKISSIKLFAGQPVGVSNSQIEAKIRRKKFIN